LVRIALISGLKSGELSIEAARSKRKFARTHLSDPLLVRLLRRKLSVKNIRRDRRNGSFSRVFRKTRDGGVWPATPSSTESAMIENPSATLAILRRLKALGVSIAMDDLGTGYSSLGYLQAFPFDKIKLDRSFIARLGQKRAIGCNHPRGHRARPYALSADPR
jgi:hypothetical protein